MEINPNNCELFFCSNTDHAILSSFNAIAPGIKTVQKSDLSLLGSPIFRDAIELATKENFSKLTHLFENLQGLHPHIAFFLLKNCLAIPKLTYFLRTTPLWFIPSILKETEGLFKSCLESILNLQLDDKSWTLASLPISFGGLGIRRLSDICIPAFLASAFGCSDFIKSQILNYGDESEIRLLSKALLHWNMLSDSQDPPLRLTVQKDWEHIISSKLYNSLMSTCSTPSDKARLLAIKVKEAKAWLAALPSKNIGTLMDPLSFRIAIALRLGCKICHQHQCICGSQADSFGHHALSCRKSYGRFSRHSAINDILKRALSSLGIPSILEPIGINRSDGKRPDGLTLISWSKGKPLRVWTRCQHHI